MITIATNNGIEFLPRLLKSIEKYGTFGHKVLVVDTGSDDEEFLKYLKTLPNVEHIQGGRDTGAYIYSYSKYPNEDRYFFMQDSLEAKDNKWLKRFTDLAKDDNTVVAHSLFPLVFDNSEQLEYFNRIVEKPHSDFWQGIFGPIFLAPNRLMKKLDELGYFIKAMPDNRFQSRGWERIWPVLFSQVGAEITSVYGDFDYNKVISDQLKGLRKFFPMRV